MANNEFKNAAAKLLEQNGVKNPAEEAMQAGILEHEGKALQAEMKADGTQLGQAVAPVQKTVALQRRKIPITAPLLLSLARTRLSLGLALVCCALMWLVVPELLFEKAFKIFNAVFGIIIGLAYGIILSFPHNEKVETDHEKE